MGKKPAKNTETEAPVADALVLTPAQQKILDGLNVDFRESYDALKSDAQKLNVLTLMVAEEENAEVATDPELMSAEALESVDDEIVMIRLGKMECPIGKKFRVRLLGTKTMKSKKKTQGWTEWKHNGEVRFTQTYYVCEDVRTGMKIGFFRNSVLNKYLPKILTKASGKGIEVDPILEIEYFGLLTDKARLENEFGIVTEFDKAHAVKVRLPKDIKIDIYGKAVVNYLESPRPSFGDAETFSDTERAERDWEATKLRNEGLPVGAIGHDSVALPDNSARV